MAHPAAGAVVLTAIGTIAIEDMAPITTVAIAPAMILVTTAGGSTVLIVRIGPIIGTNETIAREAIAIATAFAVMTTGETLEEGTRIRLVRATGAGSLMKVLGEVGIGVAADRGGPGQEDGTSEPVAFGGRLL
jgi:hypothetical protein